MDRKIILTGATGFIGRSLVDKLVEKNYTVIVLSRNPEKYLKQFNSKNVTVISWNARTAEGWTEWLEGAEAIINLAGENIGSGIWTSEKKKRLRESRIYVGQAVVDAILNVEKKPRVLIQASAIGYYGSRGAEELTENSEAGSGFLAELSKDWENSVSPIKKMDVRLVILRIGLVLGKNGGAISKLKIPFKFFLGGQLGRGDQWISWIHKDDLINIITYAIENIAVEGVINVTSPEPLMSKDFFKHIGKALNRPSWFHTPVSVLKLVLGEMAEEALLSSQKVLPKHLVAAGYPFQYPEIRQALEDVF
jgi:uncharacterized protein (TIGR01777 family)